MKKGILVLTAFAAVLVIGCVYMVHLSLPSQGNGDNVCQEVYDLLVDEGFSPIQASGIMGVIQNESNFDSTYDSGLGYGLLQWSSFREANLVRFASQQGLQVSDSQTQVLFLIQELNPESEYFVHSMLNEYHGYDLASFVTATSPGEAAESFYMVFCRPYVKNINRRVERLYHWADEFYDSYASVA